MADALGIGDCRFNVFYFGAEALLLFLGGELRGAAGISADALSSKKLFGISPRVGSGWVEGSNNDSGFRGDMPPPGEAAFSP